MIINDYIKLKDKNICHQMIKMIETILQELMECFNQMEQKKCLSWTKLKFIKQEQFKNKLEYK